MTTEEIEQQIAKIKRVKNDPEDAHQYEDILYRDFVSYVASLQIPLADKAKLILTTREIDFPRWYA